MCLTMTTACWGEVGSSPGNAVLVVMASGLCRLLEASTNSNKLSTNFHCKGRAVFSDHVLSRRRPTLLEPCILKRCFPRHACHEIGNAASLQLQACSTSALVELEESIVQPAHAFICTGFRQMHERCPTSICQNRRGFVHTDACTDAFHYALCSVPNLAILVELVITI